MRGNNLSGQTTPVADQNRRPMGYQQITDVSSAVGMTVPDGALIAVIQAESQYVRWRDDATDPTASVGMRLAPGDDILYVGNLAAIKFIEEAASAKLNISFYS